MILWVNIFVRLAKCMRKSSDLLDCAFSAVLCIKDPCTECSVVSEHLSIKKKNSDKYIFCPNFKSMKLIEIAFIYLRNKKHEHSPK